MWIGRLAPQVVYYFDAYAQLVRAGEIACGDAVEFCVPTGNFGDVLAGYFAKRMGPSVSKLFVASNCNNVLSDFLTEGVYDRNREFFKTISPSMDILISSNLERLLYYASDGAAGFVAGLMDDLAKTGRYQVPDEVLARIQETFACGWASDEQAEAAVKECHDATGYVLDPIRRVRGTFQRCILIPKAFPAWCFLPRARISSAMTCAKRWGWLRRRTISHARTRVPSEAKAPAALAALENADERFGDVIAVCDMSSYVETKCGELPAGVKLPSRPRRRILALATTVWVWRFPIDRFTFRRADELRFQVAPEVSQ